MLILTRKIGQSIIINGHIRVTVQGIRGRQVRLGIEAPPEIPILRQELLLKKPAVAEIRPAPTPAAARTEPLLRRRRAG
ncbi:MAG: hypothetical protein A2V67_12130 [Deltaproteobacteria bacterium RBG_13_61_14]|nr:MAG: hypothetical protein A2V67_12130 [Deltaproteobacteria bacterium RBG_13_61_14]